MQRALALHRVDEGDVVHALRELGKQIADPAPALAMLAERPVASLAVARLRREELQLAIGIERLALALRQFGLVVPGIHVAEAAGAEDLDDGPGLGGMMRGSLARADSSRPALHSSSPASASATPQTAAELPEESATGENRFARRTQGKARRG